MACDDDFSLPEDESQCQASVSVSATGDLSFSTVPIHSRSLSLNNINGKKVPPVSVGDVNLHNGYDDVNLHIHCFAEEDPSSNHLDPIREELLHDDESIYGYNKRLRSCSGEYRRDREEWSDLEIGCLVDVFAAKCVRMKRGNLRGRDWEEVVSAVSEGCGRKKWGRTVEQCKNKIDNLKKRYKVERQRIGGGRIAVSNWLWFEKMEQIVGSSSSTKTAVDGEGAAFGGDSSPVSRQMKRLHPGTSSGSTSLTDNIKLKSLPNPKWKRVVLKISGAALAGQSGPQNVDPKVMMLIAREVAMASHVGVEVAIVVGRRNFFCGDTWLASVDTDKTTAYQISMMASTMNAVLLQTSFEKIGVETRVQTAFRMESIADLYIRRRAIRHLEKGRIVIFGGIGSSTGSPLFTTDTAAALRASEINADVVMKATTSDAVHGCHFRDESSSFEHISFRDLVTGDFALMDMTAVSYCEESKIPVVLFNLLEPGNISRALCGDQIGILIDHLGGIS